MLRFRYNLVDVMRLRRCCMRVQPSKQAMGLGLGMGRTRGRFSGAFPVQACLPTNGTTPISPPNLTPISPLSPQGVVGQSTVGIDAKVADLEVSPFVTSFKTPTTHHVTSLSVRTPASAGEVGEVGHGIGHGMEDVNKNSRDEVSFSTSEFDIPLAVALAGTAFEAYADVENKGVVHHCTGGADVIYTDVEFLKSKMAGLLTIRSVRMFVEDKPFQHDIIAENGISIDISVGDSFVHLDDLNRFSKETSIAKDLDDSLVLFVHDVDRARLSVQVEFKPTRDAIQGKEEGAELVQGTGMVPIANIVSPSDQTGLEASTTVSLRDQESFEPVGFSLQLEFTYLPFSSKNGAAGEVAEADMEMKTLSDEQGNSANDEDHLQANKNKERLIGTPGPALMTKEWLRLWRNVAEATASSFFIPVAFIENKSTDTQVWLLVNKRQRQLVVSFRGTVHTSWRDLLTDITLTPMTLDARKFANSPRRAAISRLSAEPGTFDKVLNTVSQAKRDISLKMANPETASSSFDNANANTSADTSSESDDGVVRKMHDAISHAVGAVSETATELQALMDRVTTLTHHGYHNHGIESPPPGEAWVHSGFLSAYDSVRGAVLGLVDVALAGEESEWTVLLTGHSLGGALATLCAYDLSHRSWGTRTRPRLQMYNYGSPRVGNKDFAEAYNEKVPDTWRIVNGNDAVTAVPRLLGYCHVGHAVYLRPDGSIDIEKDSSKAPFEGVAIPHVLPAVGTAVAETVVAKVLPSVMQGAAAEMVGVTLPNKEKQAASCVDDQIAKGVGGGDVQDPSGAAAVIEQITLEGDTLDSEAIESSEHHVTAEQLNELWEQERQAWASLLGGDAMSEHMEDYYFKGIEQAVEAWRKGVLS